MQTTIANYKLIRKVTDDRFDVEHINQYALLINLGTRDFQIGVINTADNLFLLLEDYVLPSVNSNEELHEVLDHLFDNHPVLKAGFWRQVKVAFKSQKFVQIPQSLFVPESLNEYLKFNAHLDPDKEVVMPVTLSGSQIVTVFSIHKAIKEWLEGIYPNSPPAFFHQSAALIEGIMEYVKGRSGSPLYIYVDRFKLHILSVANNQLVYYNQFAIQHFSDYVKYIMLVMKSLNMDQKTSEVVLWGYIGKNSPHHHEFYKYINNITYGNRAAHLQFGYPFDEVQEHHYFDLYSLHLCK